MAEHAERFKALIAEHVTPLVPDAERDLRFPRAAIEELGRRGVFRERWSGDNPHGDMERAIALGEELGRAAVGGVAVGISVHLEAVLSILVRFASDGPLRSLVEAALDGREVGCLATSEAEHGSELTGVRCTVEPCGDGLRVHGAKRFVSLGAVADFALVLCRYADGVSTDGDGAAQLALVLVPSDGFQVARRYRPVGVRGLETVALDIDARVPADALVGRKGAGLLTVSWGLVHERIAAAAQVLGASHRAIAVATDYMHERRQFDAALFEHQAVRLRLAELSAQVALAVRGLRSFADDLDTPRPDDARESAGIKVTVARLGERVLSECMHLLGGAGYLEDEYPLARMWRDARFARLGGGTDEMMLELVAGGMSSEGVAA